MFIGLRKHNVIALNCWIMTFRVTKCGISVLFSLRAQDNSHGKGTGDLWLVSDPNSTTNLSTAA
jgi:hypothetical protein